MKKFLSGFLLIIFFFYFFVIPVYAGVFAFTDHAYYIHQDHLGSVVAVSNERGELISETKYQPYGSVGEGRVYPPFGGTLPMGQDVSPVPTLQFLFPKSLFSQTRLFTTSSGFLKTPAVP